MKEKKKEDFDYQNFEQQAIKAMYEGKPFGTNLDLCSVMLLLAAKRIE